MTGREFSDHIKYSGQKESVRRILLKNELVTEEELAVMTDIEVYDKLMENYEPIMEEYNAILIINKDNFEEFRKMAEIIYK